MQVTKQGQVWKIRLDTPLPVKQPPTPPTLQVFIKSCGGLNPDYNRKQWRHELAMVTDAGKQGVIPGLLNRSARKTFEEMAEECWRAGYLSEPDVDEMLWGLSKDIEACLVGEQRNRVYGHDGIDFVNGLAYEKWLAQLPQEAA